MTQFYSPFQKAASHPVWVLEDSEVDREILERAFKHSKVDNELIFFESVGALREAIQKFDGDLPALILLDIHLPGESGSDAMIDISAHHKLRSVPTIAFSHTGSSEDVRMMYALGASSFIKKSLTFEDTLDMVESLKTYWMESVILPIAV